MTEDEAIKEIRFNMSTIGLSDEAAKRVVEARDMAINALEKQIPKKPIFYAHDYYCSVCNSLVGNNEFEWKRFKYCDTCGQKLDWSDEE